MLRSHLSATRSHALAGLLSALALCSSLLGCDSGAPPEEEPAPFDPTLLTGVTWVVAPACLCPSTPIAALVRGMALRFESDGTGALHPLTEAPIPFRWAVGEGGTALDLTLDALPVGEYPVKLERVEVAPGRLRFSIMNEVRDPRTGVTRWERMWAELAPGRTPEEVFLDAAAAPPSGFTRTYGGTEWDHDDWRTNPTATLNFGVHQPPGPNPVPLDATAPNRALYMYTGVRNQLHYRALPRIDGLRVVGHTRSGTEVELARRDFPTFWDGQNELIEPTFSVDLLPLTNGGVDRGLFRLFILDHGGRILSYGDVMVE